MTRRDFLSRAALVAAAPTPPSSLNVPVNLILDRRARFTASQLHRFSTKIWPEAVRDFVRGGIHLQTVHGIGEVKRSPGDRPVFTGLQRAMINVVATDLIPLQWDNGRGLAGVTTRWEGFHVCLIALNNAHSDQIPFFSVNTCVHELLHALLQDIFANRPNGVSGQEREARIDWYGTLMWLFHDGAAVRASARAYLERLRTPVTAGN
ncbi:MAG TPA: hypothetical protein VGF59_03545 [Bryobacteraceae bacterium]|jgi:hypothetical protein